MRVLDELFSERDGQVLTGEGWVPAAVVEFRRQQAARIQTWAFSLGVIGVFLGGFVLGPAAVILGVVGNGKARSVGGRVRPGGIVMGVLAFTAQIVWISYLTN